MEQMLLNLARQLDAIDEESLMSLWEVYAQKVDNFEPTKRWEEAVLVFSLIQAKHWKNQLFNHHYTKSLQPDNVTSSDEEDTRISPFSFHSEIEEKTEAQAETTPPKKAKILIFKPNQD